MILVVHFKIPNQNIGFVLQFDGFLKCLSCQNYFFVLVYLYYKTETDQILKCMFMFYLNLIFSFQYKLF